MILQRLYELAVREQLLDDPAFEKLGVKISINISDAGEYLGLSELIGTSSPRVPGAKAPLNRGMELPVPVAHGSPNSAGFARFFADTLSRVLPISFDLDDPEGPGSVSEREKRARSRATFWSQIDQAAESTDDPALRAVQAFGRQLVNDADVSSRINADASSMGATAADRCTFAWDDDGGTTILEREQVKSFYRSFYESERRKKVEAGAVGVCQVIGEVVPLPTTHPMKIQGIPGGMPTGVSLVSYDKDAFQSYGLDGTANAGVGYRAADGYCRALTALLQQTLEGNPKSCLRVGKTAFLIWTRDPDDLASGIVRSLTDPTVDSIEAIKVDPRAAGKGRDEIHRAAALIGSAHSGKKTSGPKEPNRLYCLALSANAARAIVRDYLDVPLNEATTNLVRWFAELAIVRRESKGAISTSSAFPLWLLAAATARTADDVNPDFYPLLFSAALRGPAAPLPDSILVACLRRNGAEASQVLFNSPRMALIKLFLLRRNQLVTAALDEANTNPAYVCGRLLAIFEEIQYAALGNVNAGVGDKFYGIFSATPSMVFGRLVDNANKHLRKIRGENPGASFALRKRLARVMELIPPNKLPTGVLPPLEQGFFALGYYHQLNDKIQGINERKAAAAMISDSVENPDS